MRWFDLGRKMISELDGVAVPGHRTPTYERLAQQQGLAVQTLRRQVSATRFLMEIGQGDAGLANALINMPMAAIEYLMRWHRFNPDEAVRAARQLVAGRHTVRSLEAAERAARQRVGSTLRGRAREIAFRDRVAESLRSLFPGFHGIEPMPPSPGWDVPYDFRWWGPVGQVPVLIVGPYADAIQYTSRIHDWGLRAAHLSSKYGRCLMILPEPSMLGRYRAWLSHHRDPADLVLAPEGRIGRDDLPAPYADLRAQWICRMQEPGGS